MPAVSDLDRIASEAQDARAVRANGVRIVSVTAILTLAAALVSGMAYGIVAHSLPAPASLPTPAATSVATLDGASRSTDPAS
jgi:hypothetical protein